MIRIGEKPTNFSHVEKIGLTEYLRNYLFNKITNV
jgi:hypothetical protein